MAELACFSYVTIRRSNGQIPTLGGNFDYAGIEYIDLTYYGGAAFVPIDNAADLIAAFASLGYTVTVSGTRIYFADPELPITPQDIPAVLEVRIDLLVNGTPAQLNGAINYGIFDYVDLSFYGGGLVEVSSDSQLVTAFAALGISASVVTPGRIRLNGFRITGAPYQNINGYAHATVSLTGIAACSGGVLNYSLFDCVDFSPIPGGAKKEIQSQAALITELERITGKDVQADGCTFKILFGMTSYTLTISAFVKVTLVDTNEGITGLCSGGLIQYNKFDTVDLTPYGGSIVEVNSDQELIDAFNDIGISVSIASCNITLKSCAITVPINIEVGKWGTVTLIDTDENIVTCIAPNFAYSAFDSVDLTYYGGGADVPVTSNADLIAALAALGYEATISNCAISIKNLLPGQGQNIEVCKWDTISVVQPNGDPMCINNIIDWGVIQSLDLSFYGGGAMEVITSTAQLQTRLQQLGYPNTIVNGCNFKIQACVPTQNIVAQIAAPVMEMIMKFDPASDGEFFMSLSAYLMSGNNKVALANGDRIRVVIPEENVDVELIIGGTPNVPGTGYTNDVGLRWQTRILPYTGAFAQMTPQALLAGGYLITFKKKRWAIGRNYTYDAVNNVDRAIELEWRFWAKDLSANTTSTMVSDTMEQVVALLNAFADMNCTTSEHKSFVAGHPTIDNVTQYERFVDGTSVNMILQGVSVNNGVEREYFRGTYGNYGPFNPPVIAESVFQKKSGLQGVIRGGFSSDNEFHFDFPCFTGEDNTGFMGGNCSVTPYGEHLLSSYPTMFDIQAQYIQEGPFISSSAVYNTTITIDNLTPVQVVYSSIGSNRYISSVVQFTVALNQTRTIKADGIEPNFAIPAHSSIQIKLVKLY